VTSRDLTPFGSVAVCLERQSLFAAVVGRHTAGVAFAERTVSGGRLSGRGKGVVKPTGVATRGPLFRLCTKRGVGTWWRRNLSGTVSVTWRSAPGGCRRRARLVLTVVPVGPGRCGLFLLRSEGKEGERARDGRGSLAMGGNGPGKRRKREGRGSLAMGGNGPGKRRKRESRGSLAMGGNGAGTRIKRESRGSLAMGGNGPGKRRERESRGSLAAGGNGPGKRRERESRGSLAAGGNGPGKRGKRVVG
jgi:hypothetical protein